ncbi:hypothetical protein P4571_19455, partial [Niallia alba]|uniref:hypothetical protein n=1 Tax=Niallia alba TaxID=2729105 RepID=UPI002E2376E7|nr:hypothetical protein [Niallia alba]
LLSAFILLMNTTFSNIPLFFSVHPAYENHFFQHSSAFSVHPAHEHHFSQHSSVFQRSSCL